MTQKSASRLPSPMEFPDVIQAVTPKDFSGLWEVFGLGGSNLGSPKKNSAEIRYERLSAQIAVLTGHEHAVDESGRPYTRQEWKVALGKSLRLLNGELKLGMDKQMIDVLTLCYTALSESPRYGGDPVIEAKKGENTAVHSLHTMLQALRVYQKTLEKNPDLRNDIDFFRAFQSTCLVMVVHDLGEMFGEAGSLAQVADTGNWGVKDKAAYERMVFNFGVRLAIQTVIDKKGTEDEFFATIDKIKGASDIQNQGVNKTDAQMVGEVQHLMTQDIPLSARAKKLFGFLFHNWEWIEAPKESRNPFLGYLAATCERVQGTRHINRMMRTSYSPNESGDGYVRTHSLTPGYRMLVNSDYVEGHLGGLCSAVDPRSPFEGALAREAAAWTYETTLDFYAPGPEAFFTQGGYNELKLHSDGSAFSPVEVRQRLKEIGIARDIAAIEAGEVQAHLKDQFNEAVLPLGPVAADRASVVALYQRAIDTGYLPGMVTMPDGKGGEKTRGVILIRDRPAALTGVALEEGFQYGPDARAAIERLKLDLK